MTHRAAAVADAGPRVVHHGTGEALPVSAWPVPGPIVRGQAGAGRAGVIFASRPRFLASGAAGIVRGLRAGSFQTINAGQDVYLVRHLRGGERDRGLEGRRVEQRSVGAGRDWTGL